MIEKQSGFLRLLLYLNDNGEQPLTQIMLGSGIAVHQLYASIGMAREWGLVSSRVDATSYPNKNLICITNKGRVVTKKLEELLEAILRGRNVN